MDELDKGLKTEEAVAASQPVRRAEDRPRLEQRTLEVRTFCQKVESMMQDGLLDEVREEVEEEIPELASIQGVKEPVERMFALFRGVAGVVKRASGHDSDTVINPCSGSDISAGLSFDSDHLVTADDGDLFAIHDKTDDALRARLKRNLRGKLVTGMHSFGSNQGLVAYAMELVLNEADLDSLEVIEEEKVGNATMTSLQFDREGRTITHTNFSRITLRNKFDPSRPEDKLFESRIQSIIDDSEQVVLLSKAGGGSMVGPNIATTSLYPLLPEHAVVVSDANEDESLKASGASIRLESLKTDETQQALNELQGGTPPKITSVDGRTDKNIVYGYATDLRNLEIFEVRK